MLRKSTNISTSSHEAASAWSGTHKYKNIKKTKKKALNKVCVCVCVSDGRGVQEDGAAVRKVWLAGSSPVQ